MQDSSVLADEVLKIDNDPSQEFKVFSEDNIDDNSPPINMLFSKQLFELIYSKDVFNVDVYLEEFRGVPKMYSMWLYLDVY